MNIRAIILLGAPGAGKGTIAEAIRDALNIVHVSTGDMLREAVKSGTPVGRQAEAFMRKGELVPDDLIIRIVMERIDQGGGNGVYLFDGFPRTLAQAELLDDNFKRRGAQLTHVFLLDVSQAVSLERLTGRRICRKCGANFHVRNIPPKVEGVCDRCGGELYQRQDDMRETISNRLEVFQRQTAGLIKYYEQQGILMRIDSSRHRDDILADIMHVLQKEAGRGTGRRVGQA